MPEEISRASALSGISFYFMVCLMTLSVTETIQNVPEGKINIPGGHSISLSKQKVHMYMCPIPNGFRDTAISLYRRATRHALTRVAKCIDVDGGIFENVIC
jgi:hypothetical protein